MAALTETLREIKMQSHFTQVQVSRRTFLTASALLGAGAITASISGSQQPVSAGAADPALIEDLVAAYRILAQHEVLDGFGHVSSRHNRSSNRFLMSRSLAPELVTAGDLIEFDLDGNAVDARGRAPYSERFIHAEIYRARADVKAVVHAHTPSLIPYGVTSVPLRPVFHMASFIGDGVPVFDIRKTFGMTDMLVSDAAKGRALAQTLGAKTCVLMRGHGVAVVGPSVPIAVGRSIYLDLNARTQTQAMAIGAGKVTYLDPQEAQKIMEAGENRGYERAWELWKSKASRP
jgi:HCOMODA/2-hydroxy-3-carboxy-muconic semialdehyde decarboxylase